MGGEITILLLVDCLAEGQRCVRHLGCMGLSKSALACSCP